MRQITIELYRGSCDLGMLRLGTDGLLHQLIRLRVIVQAPRGLQVDQQARIGDEPESVSKVMFRGRTRLASTRLLRSVTPPRTPL